jgi:hypothetical protein
VEDVIGPDDSFVKFSVAGKSVDQSMGRSQDRGFPKASPQKKDGLQKSVSAGTRAVEDLRLQPTHRYG